MQKLTLLTTNMDMYKHPRHVPGYLGYTPTIKYKYGDTFGNTTAQWFNDYRQDTLKTSKERMGRGGDKNIPFPTYYTKNPDHVIGARTTSRDRWLAAPKYKLFNVDERGVTINKFDMNAQHYREHYRDRTETVPPVNVFILSKISHDTEPPLYIKEGKISDHRKAVAFANHVYRTMKTKPLADSSVETRRIRDVFFERR
ncbi:protein FAM166C A-like [Actinia tenebrosa]|uniref:Ciliary microtubule inner protein 2C n=1 Tax=Actinia tenebrosa TaxID=6105 RepID=A0A6P8HAT8_ACTTE|nr:protein FAM166C A-like [Actinia tenebrosa]